VNLPQRRCCVTLGAIAAQPLLHTRLLQGQKGSLETMRTWLFVLVLLLLPACERAAPTQPSPAAEAPRPLQVGLPGEQPPGSAIATALQNGWFCFALEGAERPALLPDVSGGKLRYVERLETRFGSEDRTLAIDLATGVTELIAAALDPSLPATPTAPPEVAAALRTGDRWLQGPSEAFIIRGEPRAQQLIAVTGTQHDPLVSLGPVGWGSVVRLPGGVLGALLVHDTNQDGAQGAGDESDVCVVAMALQPLYIEERTAPKRLVPHMPALRELLSQEGLVPLSLRVEDARHRLHVEVKGEPPQDPMDALDQLRRVQLGTALATGEQRLGVTLEWPGQERTATAEWRDAAQRVVHWLDFADQLLGDKLDCVGGDPDNRAGIPWCEKRDEADVLDWQAALRRIRGSAGFALRPESRLPARGATHDMNHFESPRGYGGLAKEERDRLSKLLLREVAAHRARMHRGRPAPLTILDDEGHRWMVDARGARQIKPPQIQ